MSFLDRLPGYRTRTPWKMVLASVAYGGFAFAVIGFAASQGAKDSSTVTNKPQVAATQTNVPAPAFRIVKTEDASMPGVVRLIADVVTSRTVTKDQIKAISSDIVAQGKRAGGFNVLEIRFYDDARQIGVGDVTIAKVDYAPNGDWSKASDVQEGDYSTFQYNYQFGSPQNNGILPRDDKNYPSQHELDIFFAFEADANAHSNDPIDPIEQRTAKKYNISVGELGNIINKCIKR